MRGKLFTTVVSSLATACLLAVAWAAPGITSAATGPAGTTFSVAPNPALSDTTGVTGTTGITNSGQSKLASSIAAHFGVAVDDVLAVRSQDMGWGEVYKVFYLAQMSGKTVDEILALREEEGWGVIAKSLGLHPGQGKNNLGQTLKEQRAAATPTAAPTGAAPDTKKPTDKAPKANPGNSNPNNQNQDNGDHGKPDKDKGHGH